MPPPAGESFEVLVAGDRIAPHPERLAVIELAMPQLGRLRAQALAYLESFLAMEKFAQGGEWYFEGLESGRCATETPDQFSLYFSLSSDIYGEWSVTFQLSNARNLPVAFCRRQV